MLYLSTMIIPSIITAIVVVGLVQKKEVFSIFCNGAKDGVTTVLKMIPTLIGIFLAIGMLRSSGLLDFIASRLGVVINQIKIPNEIFPLMLIKPISGSASMALATDLMTTFGVDSKLGIIAGTIMSSSETTFYVIAVYLGAVKIKRSRKILIPALIADITTMLVAICIINSGS